MPNLVKICSIFLKVQAVKQWHSFFDSQCRNIISICYLVYNFRFQFNTYILGRVTSVRINTRCRETVTVVNHSSRLLNPNILTSKLNIFLKQFTVLYCPLDPTEANCLKKFVVEHYKQHATDMINRLILVGEVFYPRDAMLARVIAIATCPSVCPSVCHAPVLCQNEESQRHDFFTIWQPQDSSFLTPNFITKF